MPAQHDDTSETDSIAGSLRDAVDREHVTDRVDAETFQTVVKLLLGGAALVVMLAIVSVLPGVDRLVPETPITVGALAVAVLSVALVGALVAVARPVEELVYQATTGPHELRLMLGVIAKHLVVLAAVFVTYWGFAGVMVPFLEVTDTVWLYDVGFLGLALVPTAFIGYYLYRALDPSAEYLTDVVLGTDETAALPEPSDGDDDPDGATGAADRS